MDPKKRADQIRYIREFSFIGFDDAHASSFFRCCLPRPQRLFGCAHRHSVQSGQSGLRSLDGYKCGMFGAPHHVLFGADDFDQSTFQQPSRSKEYLEKEVEPGILVELQTSSN